MFSLIHHLRLIFSYRPEETGKWLQDTLLKSGEITSVVSRNGRMWTLWGGRVVGSGEIVRFLDNGDYGY